MTAVIPCFNVHPYLPPNMMYYHVYTYTEIRMYAKTDENVRVHIDVFTVLHFMKYRHVRPANANPNFCELRRFIDTPV